MSRVSVVIAAALSLVVAFWLAALACGDDDGGAGSCDQQSCRAGSEACCPGAVPGIWNPRQALCNCVALDADAGTDGDQDVAADADGDADTDADADAETVEVSPDVEDVSPDDGEAAPDADTDGDADTDADADAEAVEVSPDAEDVSPDDGEAAPDADADGDAEADADADVATDDGGGAGTCASPRPLSCGATLLGEDSSDGVDVFYDYSACWVDYDESGPELVYLVQLAAAQRITITVTPTGSWDADVFVLTPSCDEYDCWEESSGMGTETIAYSASAGTTYYVVVDGYAGDSGLFDITMSCTAP